jgi:C4-dicarboxylate-specific signal transduction histidine kinase
MDRHADALPLIDRASAAAAECGAPFLAAYAKVSAGEALRHVGDGSAGLAALESALSELDSVAHGRGQVARTCKLLAEHYSQTGVHERANTLLRRAADIEEIDRSNANVRRQRAIESRREAALAERQRRDTAARIKLLEAEVAHASRLSILGEMTAGIVHELNQPLSAAILCVGALQDLKAGKMDNAAFAEQVSLAEQAVVRASDVLTRLGRFAAKKPVDLEPVDLVAAVRDSIGILENDDRFRFIRLKTELASDTGLVVADRVLLMQVFVNLLRNAAEALDGAPLGQRVVHITAALDHHGMRTVRFRDSGPGFPEFMLRDRFQPFNSGKKDGLGLGLALCQRILDAFGGGIAAANDVEGGAAVSIFLKGSPA